MQTKLATTALAAVIAAVPFGTHAQSQPRHFDQFENGTGACQGALPNFEGNLRKRPLALQNEGATAAFVTCSPQQFTDLYDPAFGTFLFFVNSGPSTVTVSCTAIDVRAAETPTYFSKTASVVPGGALTPMFFAATGGFAYGSFSCVLPPQVGIHGITSHSRAAYSPPAP